MKNTDELIDKLNESLEKDGLELIEAAHILPRSEGFNQIAYGRHMLGRKTVIRIERITREQAEVISNAALEHMPETSWNDEEIAKIAERYLGKFEFTEIEDSTK